MSNKLFKTYDEIVEAAKSDKSEGGVSKNKKARTKASLNDDISKADLKVLDAEESFEKAVIDSTGIAAAALALKAAKETLKFYQDLKNDLFPSSQSAE